MDELPAGLRKFIVDEPWSASRSRAALLIALMIAGAVGGSLEHLVLQDWSRPGWGDAFLWQGLEDSASRGFCLGAAVGAALAVSRHLLARVCAAAFLGVASVMLDGLLTDARPERLPMETAWLLGAPLGAALAFNVHLLRKGTTSYRLVLGALALSALVGVHAQSFHGAAHLRRFTSGPSEFLVPEWTGALVFELCIAGAVLGLELLSLQAARRNRENAILPMLLLAGLLAAAGLTWALRTMPLTPASPVEFIAFSADGRTVITAHRGQVIRQWSTEDPEPVEIRKLRLWGDGGGWPEFATDGRRLLQTRQDKTLTLRDAASLEIAQVCVHGGCRFTTPAMSATGSAVAVRNGRSEIWLWHSEQGPVSLNSRPLILPDGYYADKLWFDPEGAFLIGSDDYTNLWIWEVRTGRRMESPEESPDPAAAALLQTPYLRFLAGRLPLQSQDQFESQLLLRNRAQPAPCGTWIVGTSGETLEIWDLISGTPAFWEPIATGWTARVAVSPDNRLIASSDCNGRIRLFKSPSQGRIPER